MSINIQPMQSSVSGQQSVGSFGQVNNKEIKAGHFVVNPPTIRPYSFYDKIKGDKDFYNELFNPKSKSFIHKKATGKERLKGIIKMAAIVGGVFLAFSCRKNIQKYLSETMSSVKNLSKKQKIV